MPTEQRDTTPPSAIAKPNSDAPSQQQQSPLGRLAGELRNQIYNEVITAQTNDTIAVVAADVEHLQLVPLSLARTCRLFRLELLPISDTQKSTIVKRAKRLVVNVKKSATPAEVEGLLGLRFRSHTVARSMHFKICVPGGLSLDNMMLTLRIWAWAVSDAKWVEEFRSGIVRCCSYSIDVPTNRGDLVEFRKITTKKRDVATKDCSGIEPTDLMRFWQSCDEAVKAIQEKRSKRLLQLMG